MNDRELLFIALLLLQGADAIYRRICEDIDRRASALFSDDEKMQYMTDYESINSNGNQEPMWWGSGGVHSVSMGWRIINQLAAKYDTPRMTYHANEDACIDALIERLRATIPSDTRSE